MITWHILILSLGLGFAFGWHFIDTVNDWRYVRNHGTRRKKDLGDAFRAMIAALCLLSFCVAYVLRTATVILGFGDTVAGQVVFFTIIGVNVTGGLFMVVSRKFD